MKMYALLFLLLITLTKPGVCQQLTPVSHWDKIEQSIKERERLADLAKELRDIKTTAERDRNDVELARALYCGMLVKDMLTEDSLYFRNSAFIDSILQAPASRPALKAMMHLMQARRLHLFTRKSLKFNRGTYETRDLPVSYASLTAGKQDSLVMLHLKAAADIGGNLARLQGDLKWLSSNADVLLFDADLEDIAIAEQISNAVLRGDGNLTSIGKNPFLMDDNERDFLNAMAATGRKLKWDKDLISGYQTWLHKHRSEPGVYGYVSSVLRWAVYESFVEDSALAVSFEKHLLADLSSPYPLVRAVTAFQSFQFYVKNGQKYHRDFRTQYRQGYEKARQVYLKYQSDLAKYPFYEKQLELLNKQILAQELAAQVRKKQIPGKPILLTLDYRNVNRLYYRIIKNNHLTGPFREKSALLSGTANPLLVRSDSIDLPASGDYNNHAIYIKMEPLAVGNYYFIFGSRELASNSAEAKIMSFSVSNLAAVTTSRRVVVVDRTTGFPVKNAKITAFAHILRGTGIKKDTIQIRRLYTTDRTGSFVPDPAGLRYLQIVKGGDTLRHNFAEPEQGLPRDVFTSDEYEDLEDYYDEQTELQVYTDRGIYRPGQKVLFKVILVSKDPKTGRLIIFNKHKGKFYKNWMTANKPMLFLKDAKGRPLDSLRFIPDDYGSYSGIFTLPKAALPGDWQIEERAVNSFAYSGAFKVEEYKRPTFELVSALKDEVTLPGAPFEFRLKAKSFAGTNLSGIRVRYTLMRRLAQRGWSTKLIDTVGYTDQLGELLIKVNDPLSAMTSNKDERWLQADYQLEATATDGTGEQAELKTNHHATAWPVTLQVGLKEFYRKSELPVLGISVETLNELYRPDSLGIKIYALEKEKVAYGLKTDQWRHSLSELKQSFSAGELGMDYVRTKAKKLVYSERVSAEHPLVQLNSADLQSGEYELRLETGKGDSLNGVFAKEFRVFNDQGPGKQSLDEFVSMPVNAHKAGDTAKVYFYFPDSTYVLSSFSYYATGGKGTALVEKQRSNRWKGGVLHLISFVVPANAGEQIVFNYAYVRNGELVENDLRFSVYATPKQLPEIIIEKYRKILAPGEKESFSVSVKTNNQHTAAQLLSTMYDATLDKLAEHSFDLEKDHGRNYQRRIKTYWTHEINENTGSAIYEMNAPFYPNFLKGYQEGKVTPGFVKGFDRRKLDEVVVSYGDQRSRVVHGLSTGSVVTVQVKGSNSLLGYAQNLIIIDGAPYEGKLADFNSDLVTDGLVLRGQDAVALYGSRAADGVLILSTKGKIVLPVPEPPVAKVRKNFSETAFFFPSLYADKKGMYSLNFIMPESVTTWNWKMMAHTLKGQFIYAERQLYTQLKLMAEANMPRLLYHGDELLLQSRISNLDTLISAGQASCSIEDAVTGEDLTKVVLSDAATSQHFTSPANGNVYLAFRIKVPEMQLNPLKIVITATSDRFADAEEHIIPVMSKDVFVRQSQSLRFAASDTVLKAPALPDGARLYGLGVSTHSKPQSVLLNALPWLANYSYNCAEQIFNKFYANFTAYRMMKSDTILGLSYAKAASIVSSDNTFKAEPVTDELVQTATPWLGLQDKQWREQQQLLKLLDTVATKTVMEDYLMQLYGQQQSDGGMPWFKGGRSNRYISAYLLTGFGKLNGVLPSGSSVPRFEDFIEKLVSYLDQEPAANWDTYDVFARSFWLKERPLSSAQQTGIRMLLANYWKMPGDKSLYNKILVILSGMRLFEPSDPLYIQSKTQLESVLQLAIQDPINGLRWKEVADQEQPDVSAEELIELLSIAFRGLKQETELNEGLLQWILTTKSEHRWATTKGTSAAINLLTKVKGSAVGTTQAFETRISGKTLTVSDDLLSGKSSAFVKLDRRENSIAFTKTSGPLAAGNLTWYYFSAAERLSELNKSVKLHKQLYLFSKERSTWVAISDQQQFKLGAKVKVVLSVETAKPLKYVQLEDYRAAAFEPVDQASGQQSQNGLNFYRAVKDCGLQLFLEFIPSGTSEISYELQVVNEGIFTNGPAVLTGMYQPELAAYSNVLQVKTVR